VQNATAFQNPDELAYAFVHVQWSRLRTVDLWSDFDDANRHLTGGIVTIQDLGGDTTL
jgi:hypothetical protein